MRGSVASCTRRTSDSLPPTQVGAAQRVGKRNVNRIVTATIKGQPLGAMLPGQALRLIEPLQQRQQQHQRMRRHWQHRPLRQSLLQPHTPSPVPARVDRSRPAHAEGRRCTRAAIERKLLGQWRFLALADRPLPPEGRADSGLICSGLWAHGLQGVGRERTVELLRGDDWKRNRYHSSVHVALYLAWAEGQLRDQAASRTAALDLGRHIQNFLP